MPSFRSAFSALELVLVIVIVGILSVGALRVVGLKTQKVCLQNLRTKLFVVQERLHTLYLRGFLDSAPIQNLPLQASAILDSLHTPNASCGFSYAHPMLYARVGEASIAFSIEPQDLSQNPKIFCHYATPLCKDFFNRVLEK
ncbi:type II secretion system protein [uncultured Helicobacter sp.]|uniref:type II secretion system protein n=1 Tax=uncultured Helicobacter sp. TaxID=175537 RepID=UPI00374EB8FA